MAQKKKRRRMYVQSIEEKMMYRMREEYQCSITAAWKKVKEFRFFNEMRSLDRLAS